MCLIRWIFIKRNNRELSFISLTCLSHSLLGCKILKVSVFSAGFLSSHPFPLTISPLPAHDITPSRSRSPFFLLTIPFLPAHDIIPLLTVSPPPAHDLTSSCSRSHPFTLTISPLPAHDPTPSRSRSHPLPPTMPCRYR